MGRSRKKGIHDRIADVEESQDADRIVAYKINTGSWSQEHYPKLVNASMLADRLHRIVITGPDNRCITAFKMLEKYPSKTIARLLMGGVKV